MKILNKIAMLVTLVLTSAVYAQSEIPTYTEDNSTFTVDFKHRDFIIKLKDASASTGYKWDIKPEFDKKLFEVRKYSKEPGPSTLVGAPGSVSWTFHTFRSSFKEAQTVKIKFTAEGPAADSPAQTQEFSVMLEAKY